MSLRAALSAPFLNQIGESGFRWTASSHSVLRHSAGDDAVTTVPWQAPPGTPGDLTLFFRNEKLSDLIGFEYAKWHGRDAAQHFVHLLETILAESPAGETPVVSIVLDGENAWEHYPYNGYFFFDDLYGLLEDHPHIRTTTYTELLSRQGSDAVVAPSILPGVVAGSWVYGTLSTWIGDKEKNHAWDLLCAAKQSYDLVQSSGRLTPPESAAAERQLAICESSDWFWWFGDYNPSQAVASFDKLYRRNLINLYELLKLPPPSQLHLPISHGSHDAEGGTMRRAQEHPQ